MRGPCPQDEAISTKTHAPSVRTIPPATQSAVQPPWIGALSLAERRRTRPLMMKRPTPGGSAPVPCPPDVPFEARLTAAMRSSSHS
jgi:hypothetical protein